MLIVVREKFPWGKRECREGKRKKTFGCQGVGTGNPGGEKKV